MSYRPPHRRPIIIIKNKNLRKVLDVLTAILIIIFLILCFLWAVHCLTIFLTELQEFCNAIANDLMAIIT